MQQQNQLNGIYAYLKNIIYEFIKIYLTNNKILDEDYNKSWLSEINQDDIPGPYEDLNEDNFSYIYSYDGYNGYDN
jgi:hypothetical protein